MKFLDSDTCQCICVGSTSDEGRGSLQQSGRTSNLRKSTGSLAANFNTAGMSRYVLCHILSVSVPLETLNFIKSPVQIY